MALRFIAALAALLTASIVHAETLSFDDTVLVTATRTPLAIDDVLAPVIVIDGAEIRRTATFDLAETLRLYAGIELGRSGGPGQNTSMFVRGTNSNHVQVMVDGVRMNPGTLGGAAIQHLSPEGIERIEIVKGPRSTLYGTEAIGGVVNIITRRAKAPLALDATLGGGTFGTTTAGAGVRARRDAWYGGLRVDATETDGYPPLAGSTVDRGYDNLTLRVHGGWRAGEAEVEASHWQADGNVEYIDFLGTPSDQDFRNTVSSLRASLPLGSASVSLRVSRASDEIRQNQSPDFALTDRVTFDTQVDFALAPQHDWSVGLHWVREDTEAEVFGAGFDEEPETRAVFAQYRWTPARGQLLLAARHSDHDAFGGQATWNAEYGHPLGDAWQLVVAAGTAFRAPDSTERFGFGGDPALRPEHARNLELGVRGRLGDARRVDLRVYRNDIDDLIQFDPVSFMLANIDRARLTGAELAYTEQRGDWRLRQSFVFLDAENPVTGERLPRRARRSAQTSLTWHAGDAWSFGADLLASGPRKDSAFTPTVMGGYALVNLTATWAVTRSWSLETRLENALDKHYETAAGYPAPGRAVFARLRWQTVD